MTEKSRPYQRMSNWLLLVALLAVAGVLYVSAFIRFGY